jgi:hypothetical protein
MKGTSFSSDFYVTAATVIPVFYLAHAVLREVTGRLLRWVRNGFALACGISVCVCLPMAGEVAALMVLVSGPVWWEPWVTWIALGWTMGTFVVTSIAALWVICRRRQEGTKPGDSEHRRQVVA